MLDFFKKSSRAINNFFSNLSFKFSVSNKILAKAIAIFKSSEPDLSAIEALLFETDISSELAKTIIGNIASKLADTTETVENLLKKEILDVCLKDGEKVFEINPQADEILAVVFVGVNGSGKTTSIAKIARMFASVDKNMLFVAGDTFRAAASDQLDAWAQKANCEIFSLDTKSSPSTLIFKSLDYAADNKKNVLLIDTAGRLHNNKSLMDELGKIGSIIEKFSNKSNIRIDKKVLMVVDGTSGQTLREQVRIFNDVLPIDGLIVTKLDGIAKGGIVLTLISEFKIPVFFLGVGEKDSDLNKFDAVEFTEALVG